MKILVAFLVAAILGGCGTNPVQPPSDWASVTTTVPASVPPECQQRHVLPEPIGNSAKGFVMFTDKVLSEYATLKGDYVTCATWARGQKR